MPRKGKSTRRIPVDLVDLMIRNRKLIQPYDMHKRSKKDLEEQKSESNEMEVNDNNNQMDTNAAIVNENQEENIQQEPQENSQSEPQLKETHKSTHSHNLREKPQTNSVYVILSTMEVTQQEQHTNLENLESQQSPTSKKIRLQEAVMDKKSHSGPKLKRRGTPRPTPRATPRVTPKATPKPTKTKLQRRLSRRSAPYKLCSKKAKWRTAKSSQTKNTQLRTNCKCADSASIMSGSRLYLAEVALQSTNAPRKIVSDRYNSHFPKRLLTMRETQSTVILHRNPNFKVPGARRSNHQQLRKEHCDSPAKKSATMTQKKKQTNTKSPLKTTEYKNTTVLTGSYSGSSANTRENSKISTDRSNSFDGNVNETFSETIMGVVGERKDQELRPPPPPPMLPHMAHPSCSLNCYPRLAAILHDMDNFLKSVTKSTPPP